MHKLKAVSSPEPVKRPSKISSHERVVLRMMDSDDPDYINRKIREDYIYGSSITIVLCGSETHKRRFVDWEIYSTLHYEHALLGILLPTALKTIDSKVIVPFRLHHNLQSGYAYHIDWPTNAEGLKTAIETAIERSQLTKSIDNSAPKMTRNLS